MTANELRAKLERDRAALERELTALEQRAAQLRVQLLKTLGAQEALAQLDES